MGQEPYSVQGRIRGLGLTTSNLVIGNKEPNIRPYSTLVFSPKLDPLEITKINTTHFTVASINRSKGPITVVSAYFQYSHPIAPYLQHLQTILNTLKGNRLIIGIDANAHSQLWHSEVPYDRGETLESFIFQNNLHLLNEPHQPQTHSSGTNIDLTLVTRNVYDYCRNWTVHADISSSDYRLITFDLDLTPTGQLAERSKLNFSKANYELLDAELHDRLDIITRPSLSKEALEDHTHTNMSRGNVNKYPSTGQQ